MALSSWFQRRSLTAVIAVSVAACGAFATARLCARRSRIADLRAAFISYEDDATRAIEPSIAVNKADEIVIAWMRVADHDDHGDQGTRAGEAGEAGEAAQAIGVRFAGGAQLGPIERVRSPGGRFAADPVLAVLPDGAFVLSWLGFRANLQARGDAYDMRVYAARAEPGSRYFNAPALVTTDEADHEYDRPWPTVTSRGRIVVGYRRAASGNAGITVAWSDDGAATFQRRDIFSRFGFGGGLVTVCAASNSDRVYLAYFDPAAGIVVRASRDGGDSFPDDGASTITAPDENVAMEAPSCVADADEVVVAYGIGAGPMDTGSSALLARVALVRSRDGGRTFDARASIGQQGRLLLHPRMVAMTEADAGGGAPGPALAIAAYAAPVPDHGPGPAAVTRGDVRLFRFSFATPPREAAVLRRGVGLVPRRDDPAWAGDYLGFVHRGTRAYVAYVDVSSGAPQVALLSNP